MASEATDRRNLLIQRVNSISFVESAPRARLRVAGVSLDLISCSNRILEWARVYFADYLTACEGPADCQAFLVADTDGALELWDDPDAEFDTRGTTVVQRDFVARQVAPDEVVALLGPVLDDATFNLLRWLYPPLLLERDAFLLHGAGLVRHELAYVFFGQSGAGKSTSTALALSCDPSAIALGDDAVIIQLDGQGAPLLHSAPFGSSYFKSAPVNASAPVAGFYALTQDSRDAVEPLSVAAGTSALLASAMAVRFDDALGQRMELAHRFARSAPGIRKLHFTRTSAFWPLVIARNPYERLKKNCPQAQSEIL